MLVLEYDAENYGAAINHDPFPYLTCVSYRDACVYIYLYALNIPFSHYL
jgi:hypothetical protein